MAEDREIEALKTQVTEMRLEMRLKALESNTADQRAPAPKSWWQTAAEVIAVPTAIVLLVFQITQVTGSFHTDRKTEVETTKLQADELKTRLETQKMLDELAASRAKGMDAYRQELDKTLPKLTDSINKLQQIDTLTRPKITELVIAKFIILWIIFTALGLAFDLVQQAWGPMFIAVYLPYNSWLNRRQNLISERLAQNVHKEDSTADFLQLKNARRRIEFIKRTTPFVMTFIGAIPNILRWSIQISIFIALFVPLFDEIAASLGSDYRFRDLFRQAMHLDLSRVLTTLRSILFGLHS